MAITEGQFLAQLGDLTGKVAIVTGGNNGIGLETTRYLAQKGARVYVASRNKEKSLKAIAEVEKGLNGKGGPIKFHQCDISSIRGAKESAEAFKKNEGRIDILVANAGISMALRDELSPDGYEKMFATNHLGHMAFVMSLLPTIEASANKNGEARIVVVSSYGYKAARKLDYEMLSTAKPDDGNGIADVPEAFRRYCDSKLANLYFARELDQRLQARGVKNVFCNACHPGSAGGTGLGSGGLGSGGLGKVVEYLEPVIRGLMAWVGNTNNDSAKTQTYLAASKEITDKNVHGQYWIPIWDWRSRYVACKEETPLTDLGGDQEEQKKLWAFSEKALQKADVKL